jgi:hypothetical protein
VLSTERLTSLKADRRDGLQNNCFKQEKGVYLISRKKEAYQEVTIWVKP